MKKEWKESDIIKLREWVDNKSNRELSEYFDVSLFSIRSALNRFNIKRANNKYAKKDIKYIEVKRVNYLKTPCYECISHSINNSGYPAKTINGQANSMARYIYETHFKTKIPKGLLIRHKCDNKLCVNPDHLEIGTYADNSRDAVERNRIKKGSHHHDSKLNEKQVKEIKMELKNYKNGDIKRLSHKYKVSISIIGRIYRGKTWKHIIIK